MSPFVENSNFPSQCFFFLSLAFAGYSVKPWKADERQRGWFYPQPRPIGMTCCLCYLTPNIKLLIPIIVFFFFFFICPCSENTLLPHITLVAPTLLLRLENSPSLCFIYHCSPPNKIGSRGEWEGESLGDKTGRLYLNQQQTLKSYTELVFLALFWLGSLGLTL